MNWLLHVAGIDNVSGRWYAFWSGIAGDAGLGTFREVMTVRNDWWW